MSPVLKWAEVNVLSQKDCLDAYKPHDGAFTTKNHICTLEARGIGACMVSYFYIILTSCITQLTNIKYEYSFSQRNINKLIAAFLKTISYFTLFNIVSLFIAINYSYKLLIKNFLLYTFSRVIVVDLL